jgi:outer membrane protein TolC
MMIQMLVALSTLSAAASGQLADKPDPAFRPPAIDDPMLDPPAPAARQIGSWDQALELIRTRSPDFITSYQSVVRARAQREVALAAVLPTLSAQATYTHELESPLRATLAGYSGATVVPFPVVTPPADAFTVGGSAVWPLVNPRGLYALGTADQLIDISKLSFQDRRRAIAMAAVEAMLQTIVTARVAELNRTGLRSALERLALTRARLQYGQGAEVDVDRAQQDVAAARSTLIAGDESLRQAREALGVALGSPTPVGVPADLAMESFEAAVARTCRLNEDIERRPDVAAARARLEVAKRAVHDAELLFAPSLALTSQFAYSTQPVLAPNSTWSVGGILNVPIYDGGARYGALRDSRAAVAQAQQALVATRIDAIVASARAHRAIGVFESARTVAQQERDLAARVDQRTREGYARGFGTSLDLVVSAQAFRQADIKLALVGSQVDEARANAVLVNSECVY